MDLGEYIASLRDAPDTTSYIEMDRKKEIAYIEEHRFIYRRVLSLIPAYAMSIHKSQGSEFPAVVIPIHTQHYMMLQRNLFYTGVTRGKSLVVLVGTTKAVAIAVNRADANRRYCGLRRRLAAVATLV